MKIAASVRRMEAGVIDASVLSSDGITLANKEITISANISIKGYQKMKEILFGNRVR